MSNFLFPMTDNIDFQNTALPRESILGR